MMKTLTKIIEEMLDGVEDPTKSSSSKINNIRKPTAQSRRHNATPLLNRSGVSSSGGLKKPTATAKDKQAKHLANHPTANPHIYNATGKIISRAQAQQYLPQVNINNTINNARSKTWQISNSSTKIIYVPNTGRMLPTGKREGIFKLTN